MLLRRNNNVKANGGGPRQAGCISNPWVTNYIAVNDRVCFGERKKPRNY